MKKIILFILLFLQISFLTAQSLEVTGGAEHYGDVNVGGHTIEHYLDVTNTSTNPIEVVCQRTIIGVLPAGLPSWGGPIYCFAEQCYQATYTNASDTALLNAGATISHSNADVDAFTGYYDAEGMNTVLDVQYCFYDANNPSDETCVIITYNVTGTLSTDSWDCDGQGNCFDPGTGLGSYTSLSSCETACISTDINEEIEISNFYPNPANSLTNFTFNGIKAQLKIIDILGNEVKIIQLEQPGIKRIDLTAMSKGIYFGKLMVNDKATIIKKLIVK